MSTRLVGRVIERPQANRNRSEIAKPRQATFSVRAFNSRNRLEQTMAANSAGFRARS